MGSDPVHCWEEFSVFKQEVDSIPGGNMNQKNRMCCICQVNGLQLTVFFLALSQAVCPQAQVEHYLVQSQYKIGPLSYSHSVAALVHRPLHP